MFGFVLTLHTSFVLARFSLSNGLHGGGLIMAECKGSLKRIVTAILCKASWKVHAIGTKWRKY